MDDQQTDDHVGALRGLIFTAGLTLATVLVITGLVVAAVGPRLSGWTIGGGILVAAGVLVGLWVAEASAR